MIKKHLILIAGAGILALASCKNAPNITGKWQASSIESPSEDSMFNEEIKSRLASIDTLTKLDSSMVKYFQSSDLAVVKEKMKKELSEQPEKRKEQMKKAAETFSFELKSDGSAIQFGEMGQNDTARYYFADDNKKLVFDPLDVKKAKNPMAPPPQVMIFDIIHTGSDSLRLRLHQEPGNDVFVNMHKSKGDDKKSTNDTAKAEKK